MDIPAGIDNGQVLRVPNQGDSGFNGGPNGHLHVNVTVRPDPVFSRKGFDVHCEIPITYTQAVLGDELTVQPLMVMLNTLLARAPRTELHSVLEIKVLKRLARILGATNMLK